MTVYACVCVRVWVGLCVRVCICVRVRLRELISFHILDFGRTLTQERSSVEL